MEKETYYWSRAYLLKPSTFSTYFPVTPSLARTISRCPAPLKTKNALKQFSSQLPQRLKTAKAPLRLSTLTCPSFLLISYDTLCMCSLTAVYINQYIYQTAAAYCVCRFEWTKDTRGASMLSTKGPFSSLPNLLSPPRLSLYFHSSLFSVVSQPFASPPITHRYKDQTGADITSTATSCLRFMSVEDQWSGHLPDVLTTSIFLLFCSQWPQCCFLICRLGGVSTSRGGILVVFFISKTGRGEMWELLFLI